MSKQTRRILNGYYAIYLPDHPSAMTSDNWKGWLYEHIQVAELVYGRQRRADETVHHLDFNRLNNRPENLIMLPRRSHGLLHAWLQNGAPGYESPSVNGENSGKPKPVQQSEKETHCLNCGTILIKSTAHKYCSSACVPRTRKSSFTKEELRALVWQKPLAHLVEELGVCDRSIKKWCVKWELPTPPRGFWASDAGKAILSDTSQEGRAETTNSHLKLHISCSNGEGIVQGGAKVPQT